MSISGPRTGRGLPTLGPVCVCPWLRPPKTFSQLKVSPEPQLGCPTGPPGLLESALNFHSQKNSTTIHSVTQVKNLIVTPGPLNPFTSNPLAVLVNSTSQTDPGSSASYFLHGLSCSQVTASHCICLSSTSYLMLLLSSSGAQSPPCECGPDLRTLYW